MNKIHCDICGKPIADNLQELESKAVCKGSLCISGIPHTVICMYCVEKEKKIKLDGLRWEYDMLMSRYLPGDKNKEILLSLLHSQIKAI